MNVAWVNAEVAAAMAPLRAQPGATSPHCALTKIYVPAQHSAMTKIYVNALCVDENLRPRTVR